MTDQPALLPERRLDEIPAPSDIRPWLRQRLDGWVARIRTERGDITTPETVYPLVRSTEGYRDLMAAYARAFKGAADDAKAVLEEELFEAVREQDGIPMGRLYVPNSDGTAIKVAPKIENEQDFDRDQVLGALAALVAEEWAAAVEAEDPPCQSIYDAPEQYAAAVAGRALDMMGAAKMKVTHVRALAERLDQLNAPGLAAVVRDAIHTTRVYKGVNVERVDDRKSKAS